MVGVYTKVSVTDAGLFLKSHVNSVVISRLEIFQIHQKMEQNFQYVAQKVVDDKNVESFAAHFTKHLYKN